MIDLLERQDAAGKTCVTVLQHYKAIHQLAVFFFQKLHGEELLDALLISFSFEVHIGLEPLDLDVHVGPDEEHFDVVEDNLVSFADSDRDARVHLLLEDNVTSTDRRLECQPRLSQVDLLSVEARCDPNLVSNFSLIDSVCDRLEALTRGLCTRVDEKAVAGGGVRIHYGMMGSRKR